MLVPKAGMSYKKFSFCLLYCVGMDAIVLGAVRYQISWMAGKKCGGAMHKNPSSQMFERS